MDAGDIVEDFEAPDQHGNTVRLSDLVADGPLVLFFYPKAMTPGCTMESCHFRDLGPEFAALGARAVGISADAVDRQAEFDRRHGLGLTLLSDHDGRIARQFGVKRPAILQPRRVTFVIDGDRRVVEVISSELNMDIHADRALEVLTARKDGAAG